MPQKSLRSFMVAALLAGIAGTGLTGCASTRTQQFRTFAEAGGDYARAAEALAQEAGGAAVDADSYILLKDRPELTVEDRERMYTEHTLALKDYLAELRRYQQHCRLLGRYFSAVRELAASGDPDSLAEATGRVVDRLQRISPDLKRATVGYPVRDYLSEAVRLSMASFRSDALEEELRQHAVAIERELDLQYAFLAALTEDLQADLRAIRRMREADEVAQPFLGERSLPRGWLATRRELMRSEETVESVANARQAAEELRRAFIKLVEGDFGDEDMEALFEDIHGLIDLVDLMRNVGPQSSNGKSEAAPGGAEAPVGAQGSRP